jgi:carbonic anhydrase/acetyltransferase-like protein (isoleucine patch superfamily)
LVLVSHSKIKTTLSEEQQLGLKMNAEHYVANAHRFITDLEEQND